MVQMGQQHRWCQVVQVPLEAQVFLGGLVGQEDRVGQLQWVERWWCS
jgi:hypothetical protein